MGLPMYDGNLHHIEAHFPVDHGYGPTGVFLQGKTVFPSQFQRFWSFDIKNKLSELAQGQDGHG